MLSVHLKGHHHSHMHELWEVGEYSNRRHSVHFTVNVNRVLVCDYITFRRVCCSVSSSVFVMLRQCVLLLTIIVADMFELHSYYIIRCVRAAI